LDVSPESLGDLYQKVMCGEIGSGKPYWMGVEG
jgi:hypothetical protein